MYHLIILILLKKYPFDSFYKTKVTLYIFISLRRRQTTLAFLRRSNSCDSSFLNNFINKVMVEDEMNNFINDRMKSLYFIGSKKNRLDEK